MRPRSMPSRTASANARGLAVGHAAAAAILAVRAGDGSDTTFLDFDFPQGTAPGEWIFTPGSPFAAAPGWGRVTPFVLEDATQFRPGPPDALTSRKYAADLNEVKALGGDGVTTPSARTPEQTEIALFWLESSPLSWNRIARTIATEQRLGLVGERAAVRPAQPGARRRLHRHVRHQVPLPLLAAGLGDPRCGQRRQSGHQRRPHLDAAGVTPPIPDYDSGHAVEGGAAAAVLRRYFATDHVPFSTCSLTLPAGSRCNETAPVSRSYSSFSQAAEENGLSRILIGFHFRKAVREGIEHGRQVGRLAARRFLRPVR